MALWRSPVRARYGPQKKDNPKGCPFSILTSRDQALMIALQIKLSSSNELTVKWDDGHDESHFPSHIT